MTGDVVEALSLFAFAAVVGIYGTLVGAGGGFLIVPALLIVFGVPSQNAVGTSLAVVLCNAASGTVGYARLKRIDYRTGIRFALATVPGAIVGAYLTTLVESRLFSVIFGVLLIAMAILMLVLPRDVRQVVSGQSSGSLPRGHTSRVLVDARGERFEYSFNEAAGVVLSFAVGFASSFLGVGGGIFLVPAFIYLLYFPPHIAVATSLFVLVVSASVGSVSHAVLGNVLLGAALVMSAGVVIGAQIGTRIATRMRGLWIVRLLSLALGVGGARLLVG